MPRHVANDNGGASHEAHVAVEEWMADWLTGRIDMRSDVFEVTAGWGLREEGAQVCAARLSRMLENLAGVHPAFTRLMWTGMGRGVPTRDMQRLRELGLLEGLVDLQRTPDDAGKHWLPDGYRLPATADLDGPKFLVLTVRVGRHLDHRYVARFGNIVTVVISALGDPVNGGIPFEALKPILIALVEAWQPEWAGAFSVFYGAKSNSLRWPPPFYSGSWMIYLTQSLAQKINVPASALVERMPGDGLLMQATDQPFDHENPEHVRAADAIQACLAPFESWCRGF